MSSSRLALACGAALFASGCNQIFGLETTGAKPPVDAQFFDMPLDAPFTCPPVGTTPQFSELLHQPILQSCNEYTLDTNGRSFATCGKEIYGMAEGTVDMLLAKATGDFQVGGVGVLFPRLTPEGDDVFATKITDRSSPGEIHAFHRAGGAWSHAFQVQVPFVLGPAPRTGSPSLGPVRRLMVINGDTLYELDVDAAGVATTHDQYSLADLGATFISSGPNLSPDGLRMTLTGIAVNGDTTRTLYTDRPSTSARFRAVDAIPAFAFAQDPFMTADCARIYFSAASSVLYVQQQ